MQLVELAFPPEATEETRDRARKLCESLGKTPVEVPDIPGFVVNRLLFPYLFSAVELLVETGMTPEDIDNCMTLGAGMPMGPIALLDYVGLDVSQAIGESIGAAFRSGCSSWCRKGRWGASPGGASTTTTEPAFDPAGRRFTGPMDAERSEAHGY